MIGLIAQNSEIFKTGDDIINFSLIKGVYQTFKGNGMRLDSIKLYLERYGTGTHDLIVKIYAHTGTYGISGKPTGLPLAESEPVAPSTLLTSFSLITFNFLNENRIKLIRDTPFVLLVSVGGVGTANVYHVGLVSPSNIEGNEGIQIHSNFYTANKDLCFYIYGEYDPFFIGFGVSGNIGKPGQRDLLYANGIYQMRMTRKGKIPIKMKFYVPTNPRTTLQQENRQKFADAMTAWGALTSGEKLVYIKRAKTRQMKGWGLFIREYYQAN